MEVKKDFVSLQRKQETITIKQKNTIMKTFFFSLCVLVWIGCDLALVYEYISKCNSVNEYIVYGAGVMSFIAFSIILIYAFIYALKD